MTAEWEGAISGSLETTAAPHIFEPGLTTRRMMVDVLWGLVPVGAAAVWFFRIPALIQISVCLAVCLATEYACCRLRGRRATLADGSAVITALILAFSLPPRVPLYATVAGSFIAVAVGKMVFGGLGQNVFNPAMVGRAFLMVSFPAVMTSWVEPITVDATSSATPLAAARFSDADVNLVAQITGETPGCLGETSSLAVVAGGCWILARGAGDWRLTVGMLIPIALIGGLHGWLTDRENALGAVGHLLGGGALLGAFFIVTDPVSSPLTRPARWLFGLVVGTVTMIIRLFAGYPEGVMFAVLVGNSVVPLLDRWTTPTPVGGHAAARREGPP